MSPGPVPPVPPKPGAPVAPPGVAPRPAAKPGGFLGLRDEDRVRVLAAVARKGPSYQARRVVVITMSLLVLLAVPLLGIARVDLWGGRHVLLGEPATAVKSLQGIVVCLGVLYGVTFVTNTFLGRFFCGWGCPVGYVSRLGEDVDLRRPNLLRRVLSHLAGAGFVATFVGAVMLWWVDPLVVVEGSVRARVVTGAVFAALWAGGFLHAFVWRFGFCLSVCPIGLYYRYVTSRPPVGIVFAQDPDPCIQCGACTKVCPVDLEPRDLGKAMPPRPGEDPVADERYGDAECLRCGDCVEACRMIFAPRKGAVPPLRFGFHAKDEPGGDAAGGDPPPKLDGRPRTGFDLPPAAGPASTSSKGSAAVSGTGSGPAPR